MVGGVVTGGEELVVGGAAVVVVLVTGMVVLVLGTSFGLVVEVAVTEVRVEPRVTMAVMPTAATATMATIATTIQPVRLGNRVILFASKSAMPLILTQRVRHTGQLPW